jgi:hypothetical protein
MHRLGQEKQERAYLVSGIVFLITFFIFFFNAIRLWESNVLKTLLDYGIYMFFIASPILGFVFLATFEIVDSLQTKKVGLFRIKRFLGRIFTFLVLLFPFGALFVLLNFLLVPLVTEKYAVSAIIWAGVLWALVLYTLVKSTRTKEFLKRLEKGEW